MRRFEGKTVLVTGASSGIGFAAAAQLAREGARIVAASRDAARLEECMHEWECPSRHIALPFDARNEQCVTAAADSIRAAHGPLHGAVLCAGRHSLRPMQLLTASSISEILESNITATLLCSKLFSRCSSPEGGSIVWLSSAASFVGNPAEAVYAAAKGALISACRSAAVELASKKIRVNVIAPGVVDTPMSQSWLKGLSDERLAAVKARHLLGMGTPCDVAGPILFLLSDDARWITGTALIADGGFSCH